MKDAKAHYEDHLVGKLNKNPKLFWNYTRHFTRRNSTVDTLEHEGTKVYIKTIQIRQKFSITFFFNTESLVKDSPIDIPLPKSENMDHILSDITFTPDIVKSWTNSISVNILQICTNLAMPLSNMFNHSMQSGQIPRDERDANVTP